MDAFFAYLNPIFAVRDFYDPLRQVIKHLSFSAE